MSQTKKDGKTENKKGFLRRNIKRIFLIVVSAALLLFLIFKVDPGDLYKSMRGLDYRIILFVVVLYFINLATKAFRWQTLLATGEKKGTVKYLKALEYFTICLSINNMTPGRVGGEPVRAYLPHKGFGLTLGKTVATIFMEKCMDIAFTIVLVVVGALFLLPILPLNATQSIAIGTGIMVLLFSLGIFIVLYKEQLLLKKAFGSGFSILKKIGLKKFAARTNRSLMGLLDHFNEGLRIFGKNKGVLLSVALLTMIIWLNEAFRLWLIMRALGLDVGIGSAILVSAIATIAGVILPLGIGNLASVTMMYSALGIDYDNATAAGVLTSLTSIWLCVPIGALLIFITGIKPSSTVDMQAKDEDNVPHMDPATRPTKDIEGKKMPKKKKSEDP